MPRRETPFVPDQYYHFYNRGNNRGKVFFERENYLYFLKGFVKYVLPFVEVIAYCLMPTHYHILLRIKTSEVLKTSEVSNAMMKFIVSYTKAINKRFERVGALFQGQFHGEPIQTYSHLLALCIYIHTNPVKDGLVFLPEEWEYSNYLEWMQLRDGKLVDKGFISEHFGSKEEYQ
ncbi:MAG TPA: transposase, partial [Anaerolineae bacterium]|nr:transposase [Anaerolineae bacterium]